MNANKDLAITTLQLLCNAAGAEFEDEEMAVQILEELIKVSKEETKEKSSNMEDIYKIEVAKNYKTNFNLYANIDNLMMMRREVAWKINSGPFENKDAAVETFKSISKDIIKVLAI